MSASVRQAHLTQGERNLRCWIDAHPHLCVGIEVTLRGEEGRWRVESLGDLVLDRSQLRQKWDVGGLA